MRRSARRVLAFLLLAAATARAAAAAETPVAIGEAVRIASKVLGEERTILVATPEGYARGTSRYPVLYLTDGEAHFQEVCATADFLRRNGFMPPVLVVGVVNTDRTRDLAPPRADLFLDFFEKELVPLVESKYRTVPFRIFAGHSLGGLFGLRALLVRPDLFHAVVAASPVLAWDGGSEVRRAETFLAARKAFRKTLFVSIGAEGPESRAAFDAFLRVLEKNRPDGFRFGSAVLTEEDHFSVVLQSHYAGLRKIFEGWHIPRKNGFGDLEAGGPADLKARFAALSERLGFAFTPSEALVNLLARQAAGRNEPGRALEFLRYNAEAHPESAEARENLAKALEKMAKPGGP